MTQATKVAEIFAVAGEAFTKLSKLAMSLQSNSSQDSGKWEDEEIDMLKKAISQFGNEIEKISERIKSKSTMQIKGNLKTKVTQNLTNYPINNKNTNTLQKPVVTAANQNTNMDTQPVNTSEQAPKNVEVPATKHSEQHVQKTPEQHVTKSHEQYAVKLPEQYVRKPVEFPKPLEQNNAKSPEQHQTKPPGLQHIGVRAPVIQTEQNPLVAMKPRLITIQGQNISERSPVMERLPAMERTPIMEQAPVMEQRSPIIERSPNMQRSPVMTINPQSQIMSVGTKNLAMKPTGVTPASIITSQLNKSPSKMLNQQPRTPNQKTKMDSPSLAGMMSLAEAQSPTKKVKVDSPNLNILTSALLSQKPMNGPMNPMNRSQASVTPGAVPAQGFQVIMPSSAKPLYPISVRPTGIVQRVADANSTTGNIDVES